MPPTFAMAHYSLIVGCCLLLSRVNALQVPAGPDNSRFNPYAPENNGVILIRSWVSMNELFCAQAPARVAEGALALFKAMPRGYLFHHSFIHNINDTCEDRGYNFSAGEDPCYPELQMYYRKEEDKKKFMIEFDETLSNFSSRYNLSNDEAVMLDDCSCHDESPLKKKTNCDKANNFTGSWVHHEPGTNKELMCDSGRFLLATRALAILKSTAQLPMHLGDQIAPVECDQVGFTHMYPPIDHCFTGLHMWIKTPDIGTDELIKYCGVVEGDLQHGGFTNYTDRKNLEKNILEGIPGCHCAPHSEIGESMKEICVYPGVTSPIRDWWKE